MYVKNFYRYIKLFFTFQNDLKNKIELKFAKENLTKKWQGRVFV